MNEDAARNAREAMGEAIQSSARINEASDEENPIEDAMLLGWVVMAEWMDPEGHRWLSRLSGLAGGDRSAPDWQLKGYLHTGLYEWEES